MFQNHNCSPESMPQSSPLWDKVRLILDETLNTIVHGAGLFLSSFGVYTLWATTHLGCLIYLASAISVYLFSTLSHAIPGRKRELLRLLDQGCIFFLIAGTYTPLIMAFQPNNHGYILLSEIWLASIIGFIAKTYFRLKTIVPYVILGWCPAVCCPWILGDAPWHVIGLIVLGGLAYTAGLYFFLRDHKFGHHALWHLFVLAGSALHFAAIYQIG